MKNSRLIILSFTIIFLLSIPVSAQDGDTKTDKKKRVETIKEAEKPKTSCCGVTEATAATVKPWNTVCPVMGNKIDATVKTVEYDGKLYGFCCDGCDDKFAKDPARYSRNLSKDGTRYTKARS
jgi:YHS domain-containing protein